MSTKISLFNNFNYINFFNLIFLTFPFLIITGPALPDILISISSLLVLAFLVRSYSSKHKIFFFFIIFWLYLIASSLLSSEPLFSIKSSLLYIRFFIFSLGIYIFIKKQKILDYHFRIFLIIFIFIIFDASYQFFTGYNVLNFKLLSNRASSLFRDELILGGFIYTFFPLVFFYYFRNKKINTEIKLIIFSIIIIYIIFLTGERINLLRAIILVLILNFLFMRFRIFISFLTIFLFLFITILFSTSFKDRFYNDFKLRLGIGVDRNFIDSHWGAIYSTSYELFKNNLLIGIGPNNYRKSCNLNDIKKNKLYVDINQSINNQNIIELKRDKLLNLKFLNNIKVNDRNNYILKKNYDRIILNNRNLFTKFYLINQNKYIEGYYNKSNFKPYDLNGKLLKNNYISKAEYNETVHIKSYSWYIACSTHPHHLLLQIATETGIFGLFLFLGNILLLFILIYRKKNRENLIFITIGYIYILNMVNPFFTYGNFFNNYTNIFFWFFIVQLFLILKFLKQSNSNV